MTRLLPIALALASFTAQAEGSAPAALPAGAIQADAAALTWKPMGGALPAGTMVAVLEGDPKAKGLFTLRLKLPPGFLLAPHTHPADERVTVLEGEVFVGFGEALDRSKGRAFTAGAFYVTPTPTPHAVWSDKGATLQITGIGPWEVHPVAPKAPAKPK
jgi:hypothetical protein